MSVRVYVLLNVTDEKAEPVIQTLRNKPGVTLVDRLEGPPDVVLLAEAPNRRKLAKLTIEALTSVESMTEDIWLFPVTYEATASIKKTFTAANHQAGKTEHASSKAHCCSC